jgi:hypothetical protein
MSKSPHQDDKYSETTASESSKPAIRAKNRQHSVLDPCFGWIWLGRSALAILLVATPAMASVTISLPTNGSTVTSPVQYSAISSTTTCARGVASMGVYVDNKLIYVSYGHKLSVQLPLQVGKYQTVVEEWDKCGGASYTRRIITVSANTPPPPPPGNSVELSWNAPESSAVPVVGYNVYRSTSGSSAYQLLNSTIDAETTYVDSTVQAGQTYDYIVESIDNSGVASPPTSPISVTIP